MNILICDDEAPLRRMVAEYLTERGHECAQAEDAAALRRQIARRRPDLIVLDIRMPGEDGLAALRTLRIEGNPPPVIMLTAVSETIDRVVGLELGADDYLAKPVDLRELEARITAVLRRANGVRASASEAPQQVAFGDHVLDLAGIRLNGPAGEIELTAMEFALLKVFVSHAGRVLTRDQLLDLAHDRGWEPFDRSIDLRIPGCGGRSRKIRQSPAISRRFAELAICSRPSEVVVVSPRVETSARHPSKVHAPHVDPTRSAWPRPRSPALTGLRRTQTEVASR